MPRYDAKGSTGLMIIRAWVEQDSPEPLRAHLRVTRDVALGFERSFSLARTDSVVAAVEKWLATVIDDHTPVTD